MNPGWAKVPQAAEYYGVSVRTMRKLLNEGMPHVRLPSGTKLIEISNGNEWLRGFSVGKGDVEIVNEILKEFK